MPEAEVASQVHIFVSQNVWGIYLCLLVAPFVQEDAAVLGAAALSLSGAGNPWAIFFFISLGLSVSGLSKYAIGCIARTQPWAAKYAKTPAVAKAEKLVHQKIGSTLLAARFITGTRVALYVASGYFQAPRVPFILWIIGTSILYTGVVFALFHAVGAVAGEAAKVWLPVIAIGGLILFMVFKFAQIRFKAKA